MKLSRREFLKMVGIEILCCTIPELAGCKRAQDKSPKVDFHVHPYLENYGIDTVFDEAIEKNIKILGLESYNEDMFPLLLQKSKNSKYRIDADDVMISVDDGKLYVIRAIEFLTKQNFHLILAGNYKIKPRENIDIEEAIEANLGDDSIIIFDHPYVNVHKPWKDITKEKEKELEKICRKYKKDIFLEWNAYLIPYMRLGSANRKVENLSSKLEMKIVADTDLHARNKRLLRDIATSYIKVDFDKIKKGSGKEIISSLKKLIKNGNYENHKEYVSVSHNIEAFVIPLLFGLAKARG